MDKSKSRILLFIPMYNCENQITRVLDQIDYKFATLIDEVIIVNNRSTDNGETVVKHYLKNNSKHKMKINLLLNNDNYGLGGSHKVAFNYAKQNQFDYIIVLHGDDQGNLADLYPLLNNGIHEQYDCLLGARFMRGSRLQGYSKFRTFGNRVYNALFSIAVGKAIYDLGSGLNVYRVSILDDNFYINFPDDLTFNYCLVLASMYYKHSIKFFPISWREDDQISNVKLYSQSIRVLRLLWQFVINKKLFLQSDHRVKKIDGYSGQLVTSNWEEQDGQQNLGAN